MGTFFIISAYLYEPISCYSEGFCSYLTYLTWSQVTNARVGAVNGGLLHDAIARRLAVTRVLGTHAVLPVEHAPATITPFVFHPRLSLCNKEKSDTGGKFAITKKFSGICLLIKPFPTHSNSCQIFPGSYYVLIFMYSVSALVMFSHFQYQ